MISNFTILVLTHFISDIFIQPSSWAINKTKSFKPLLYHSLQYTALFVIPFYLLELNWLCLPLIFLTHLAIDSRKPLIWWNKVVKREKNPPEWLVILQDQILHIIVLIPAVY